MTDLIPFICECADEGCTEIVRLSVAEYQEVRADSAHFLNALGHDSAAGPYGEVVAENDRYVVVRKVGEAAEMVEDLDRREPV